MYEEGSHVTTTDYSSGVSKFDAFEICSVKFILSSMHAIAAIVWSMYTTLLFRTNPCSLLITENPCLVGYMYTILLIFEMISAHIGARYLRTTLGLESRSESIDDLVILRIS